MFSLKKILKSYSLFSYLNFIFNFSAECAGCEELHLLARAHASTCVGGGGCLCMTSPVLLP
jgi:hypothetical protein